MGDAPWARRSRGLAPCRARRPHWVSGAPPQGMRARRATGPAQGGALPAQHVMMQAPNAHRYTCTPLHGRPDIRGPALRTSTPQVPYFGVPTRVVESCTGFDCGQCHNSTIVKATKHSLPPLPMARCPAGAPEVSGVRAAAAGLAGGCAAWREGLVRGRELDAQYHESRLCPAPRVRALRPAPGARLDAALKGGTAPQPPRKAAASTQAADA